MTVANDSILVTPGSGATVATHAAGGKGHQVVMLADEAGHIVGTRPTFVVQSTFQTIAQNAKGLDIWNGSSSTIRLLSLGLQKNMAAVTGIAQQYDLNRYTGAPSAGTALTPQGMHSADSLPAGITCGRGRTITLGSLILSRFFHAEETNVAAQVQEAFPYWPPWAWTPFGAGGHDLLIPENEGIALTEITASPVGTWNVIAFFTTE